MPLPGIGQRCTVCAACRYLSPWGCGGLIQIHSSSWCAIKPQSNSLCLRRGLEGCKTLCVVDDASHRSNGCHNADQPAENTEGLQC